MITEVANSHVSYFSVCWDIMVVGICMLAYAGKEEYSGGMLFGVHIPKEKVDEKTVRDMAETYKKKYKKFQRWNMILGILVCGVTFAGIGIFMIVWTVWLTEYIVGLYWIVYGTHRRMYNLKVENGWVMESAKQDYFYVWIRKCLLKADKKCHMSKKWVSWYFFPDLCGYVVS
ncbi:MAG: hypothetical protein ACLTKE_08990 [Coprococcus sp.]